MACLIDHSLVTVSEYRSWITVSIFFSAECFFPVKIGYVFVVFTSCCVQCSQCNSVSASLCFLEVCKNYACDLSSSQQHWFCSAWRRCGVIIILYMQSVNVDLGALIVGGRWFGCVLIII